MSIIIEAFKEEYLGEIAAIYNYYVEKTTATWHTQPLAADEMKKLVVSDNEKYKTFVVKDGGRVCGYVSVREFKPREGYTGTAEIGIYFDKACCGKGLGSKALAHLENYSKNAGLHVLIASISSENAGSIRLFERNGYMKCAHLREVGQKFGMRLDAVIYQKILD